MTGRPIKIGVTGTRERLTDAQIRRGTDLLADTWEGSTERLELHHGDCVGADATLHIIASAIGYRTVAHPPIHAWYRAHCDADTSWEPKTYLARNADIVTSTDALLAFPKEMTEAKRGGTWWTVRYARKVGRRLVIVWPDGTEQP